MMAVPPALMTEPLRIPSPSRVSLASSDWMSTRAKPMMPPATPPQRMAKKATKRASGEGRAERGRWSDTFTS